MIQREKENKRIIKILKQRTINAFFSRDASTAISQLLWSQSLKNIFKKIVKLYMAIKNNNEAG